MENQSNSSRPAEVAFHGGVSWDFSGLNWGKRNGFVVADVLDAPFPPSPKVRRALKDASWDTLCRESPPTNAQPLFNALSSSRKIRKDHLLVSSGSSSILFSTLPRLLTPDARVLMLQPTYSEYSHILKHVIGCRSVDEVQVNPLTFGDGRDALVEILDKLTYKVYDAIFLVNPNSPSGTVFARKHIEELASVLKLRSPNTILWLDECYIDFAVASSEAGTMEPFLSVYHNLLICKSLSKCLALSGLRVAYLAGQRSKELRRWIPPWSVSLPAQVAVIAALNDREYYFQQYVQVSHARNLLVQSLQEFVAVTTGVANFVCVHLNPDGNDLDASTVVDRCRKEHGVFLRRVDIRVVRVAVRLKPMENERIVAALRVVVMGRENVASTSTKGNRNGADGKFTCAWLMTGVALWGVALGCKLLHADAHLASGIAISPTFLSFLRKNVDTKKVTLLFHQLFSTIIWSTFLLVQQIRGAAVGPDGFFEFLCLGFTVSVFSSELSLLQSWKRDKCTWLHHLATLGSLCMLLSCQGTWRGRFNLAWPVRFCAVACPSYTCIPKLCRCCLKLLDSTVDAIWCVALLLWIFGRLYLNSEFGFGFHKLVQFTGLRGENFRVSAFASYLSVIMHALLLCIYLINGFWVYKKLESIRVVASKHFSSHKRHSM